MKKYLMTGIAALALSAGFTSCNHDFAEMSQDEISAYQREQIVKTYEKAFVATFGQPAPNQDWGFGVTSGARTRSQSSPECPNITAPWTEADVTNYLPTASEPNSANITNNDAGAGDLKVTKEPVMPSADQQLIPKKIQYNNGKYDDGTDVSDSDKDFYTTIFRPQLDAYNNFSYQTFSSYGKVKLYIDERNERIQILLDLIAAIENSGRTLSDWLTISQEPEFGTYSGGDFVLNFKITNSYTGTIGVAASEGYEATYDQEKQTTIYGNKKDPFTARTIVVTGTWNINNDQRIGSGGLIVIADGGTVNIASGKTLEMVNHARLVVLRGGTLTGEGTVMVSNGNGAGEENYNGGTISVGTFNNNFGKFYNNGDFIVNEYQGGAQESNFYNHHLVKIHHFAGTGSTANARIFNNCQFYVQTNARIRNYEGVGGSALIVGGELMFSSSMDGTSTPTYVGLASGALIQCNTLYNNGTSWTGPTSGYAALDIIDKIVYLNWQQDAPQTGGYFENNIYVRASTWTNVPDGNGSHQTDPSNAANYAVSIADYKFFTIVANCRGNGGVKKLGAGNTEIIPASSDFSLGTSGCTPGLKGDIPTPPSGGTTITDPTGANLRIMAEDLSATESTDFDFNDVVFDVYYGNPGKIIVQAAGGTLPLRIKTGAGTDEETDYVEVHSLWNQNTNIMINTNASYANSISNLGPSDEITLGYSVANADEANTKIVIEVKKTSNGVEQWIPMEAEVGKPAAKFACETGTNWADERQSLAKDTNFKDWVQGAISTWKWNESIK